MKAIVLTCDKYRACTEYAIRAYKNLWPSHPFVFRVPYQQLGGEETNRIYVQCGSGIQDTMQALLSGLDDEEWVYWCLDDKYPVALDIHFLEEMLTKLPTFSGVDGVCFFWLNSVHLGEEEIYESLFPCADNYLFWIPQFLRVRVLRSIFSEFPWEIPRARMMDGFIAQRKTSLRRAATKKNHAVFGESTIRGEQTIQFRRRAGLIGITSDLPMSPFLAPTERGRL